MKARVRVVLADDHPVFRMGLRSVLAEAAHLDVVAEAADGASALAMIEEHQPDVAVVDLDMPLMDGVQAAEQAAARRIPTRVVMLTGHKSGPLVNKVLDAGLLGFVLKDSAVAEIVECIDAVAAGRAYISPQLSAALVARRAGAAALGSAHRGLDALTPTERRVLSMVAQGKSSREIAELLFISVRTVEHHRAAIAAKLQLAGANALVKFAIANRAALT